MRLLSAWPTSLGPMPGILGAGEKPKPGRLGAITWNAGLEGSGGLVSWLIIGPTSMKLPGQPWMKRRGMASLRLERW